MELSPDWIQVIISIITAVALIYTLLLQRKTAEDQKAMLLISEETARKHIMPVFKAWLEPDYGEFGEYYGLIIIAELERNDAYNTLISVSKTNPLKNNDHFAPAKTFKVAEQTRISYLAPGDDITSFSDAIHIDFSDLDDRYYRQTIQVYRGIINITAPSLI